MLHDNNFARTGGGVKRAPEEMTFDEVRRLDAGSWKNAKYAGEHVPTMAEMLDVAKAYGRSLLIDLKMEGLTDQIAKLVVDRHMEDQVILGPWTLKEAAAARKSLPNSPIFLINAAPKDWTTDYFWPLLQAGVRGFNFEWSSMNAEFINQAARRGMAVYAWTIDSPKVMLDMATKGVAAVLTNDPALCIKTLDAWTDAKPAE